MHPNIFDKLIHTRPFRWMEPFYTKHKEALLYLFFGGLTFLISVLSFALLTDMLLLDALVSNVIFWIIATLRTGIVTRLRGVKIFPQNKVSNT